MSINRRLKNLLSGRIGRTLRESFSYVAGFITNDDEEDREKQRTRFAINSLIRVLLVKKDHIIPERREICRRLLEERFDHEHAEKRIQELEDMTPANSEEVIQILNRVPEVSRRQIIEFVLALAVALGNHSPDINFVFSIGMQLGVSDSHLHEMQKKLIAEKRKQQIFLSGGMGVLVAVAVLFLFVITATLLQSVIFGLIAACVLLPLEKFMEKQLREKSGLFYLIAAGVHWIFSPLLKLSSLVTRRNKDNDNLIRPNLKSREDRSIIRKAVSLTAFVTIIFVLLFIIILGKVVGHYMHDLRSWMHSGNSVLHSGGLKQVNAKLDKWKSDFEKQPVVKGVLNHISDVLNDPAERHKLFAKFLERRGGVANITAGILGAVTSFFADLLLTVFFALLFLFKLAEFCRNDDSDQSKSEYFIRMVFNGIWLPSANDRVVSEAKRIITGVFFRLRVWLKGYLALVMVDSTVYITTFFLMGLPFFWLLGLIAGCGIMLPYLGPVISCGITVLVSIAFGCSGSTVLWIIIAYLIYNGIIEQFILYPAVIGESLGLSTLETIIVVLLGAVFAGISGMILALPAASVAKYIIPQLYRSFFRHKRVSPETSA